MEKNSDQKSDSLVKLKLIVPSKILTYDLVQGRVGQKHSLKIVNGFHLLEIKPELSCHFSLWRA